MNSSTIITAKLGILEELYAYFEDKQNKCDEEDVGLILFYDEVMEHLVRCQKNVFDDFYTNCEKEIRLINTSKEAMKLIERGLEK